MFIALELPHQRGRKPTRALIRSNEQWGLPRFSQEIFGTADQTTASLYTVKQNVRTVESNSAKVTRVAPYPEVKAGSSSSRSLSKSNFQTFSMFK
jgi:hypothetical protein